MTVHANSISAFHSLNLSERAEAVLRIYVESSVPLSDREVMRRMGLTDMNACRPRCTELIDAGLLEECGSTIDRETSKRVRLCRPCGKALAIKPVDPAKALRKKLCQRIADMHDQGGQTIDDLARTFPGLGAQEITLAVGVCWSHGVLEKRPFMQRQGQTVYGITPAGRALLAKTENACH